MIEATRIIVISLLIAITLGGFFGWVRIARFWWSQSRKLDASNRKLDLLLPPTSRHRPSWTVADFFLAMGLGISLPVFLLSFVSQTPGPEAALEASTQPQPKLSLEQLAVQLFSYTLIVSSLIGFISLTSGNAIKRIGLTFNKTNLLLGLKSTPIILLAVMLLNLIATTIVKYEHPVLNELSQQQSVAFWLMSFLVTGIATPIYEEFVFRGLLQGSLQALADKTPNDSTWRPDSIWPVIAASFIFAMLHFPGQGAAPIPIFGLSVGLGYLYRQTGSLWPPILVHMILNSLTLMEHLTKTPV